MLLRIYSFEKDDENNNDNEDDNDDDENGTSSQYKSKNKKPKYNAPGDDDDSMDNFDMAKSYPHLAQALGGEDGFDPTNPSVRKSMHCLLTELNDLLSTTYGLNVSNMSYKKISYVRVPRTSSAAVQSSAIHGCPITPKVHTMLTHVEWQMKNIPGGLGDKMEDWVERLHQWGMQQRRRFCTVQNPLVCAMAREKASSCNTHPDVLAQVEATDEGNKRKLSEINEVDILSIKRKMQCKEGRIKAL